VLPGKNKLKNAHFRWSIPTMFIARKADKATKNVNTNELVVVNVIGPSPLEFDNQSRPKINIILLEKYCRTMGKLSHDNLFISSRISVIIM